MNHVKQFVEHPKSGLYIPVTKSKYLARNEIQKGESNEGNLAALELDMVSRKILIQNALKLNLFLR